ncbi:MAG: alpha/beta hydrolase [Saprospiraceae bacterium]|nr:alpha/beta hydrolase [Saprospiraceae bacterium]
MKTIYFSHGKESGPNGRKIQSLVAVGKQNGFETHSIDYTHLENPDARVEHLLKTIEADKPKDDVILVGSSMGGYVSMAGSAKMKPAGMFLMAPALYLEGFKVQEFHPACPVEIVHGWNDGIIPFEHSLRFAEKQKCTLHLVNDDHRLSASVGYLEVLFDAFLKGLGR